MGKRGNGEGGIYRPADGVWCASVDLGYAGGKRRRKVVYGKTRRQVAEKLAAMNQARSSGRPVVDDSRRLGDYLEHWLSEVIEQDRKPATAASDTDMVHRHIALELGHIRLDRLSAMDVRSFLRAKSTQTSVRGRPLSTRSVRYLHAILRSVLSQAVRDDLDSRNVCELVLPPRSEQQPFQGSYLDPDQARALLSEAEEALREARQQWHRVDEDQVNEEQVVHIATWRFGGRGYRTLGDQWLAGSAAKSAVEARWWGRLERRCA